MTSQNSAQLLADEEEAMRQILDGRQVGIWTSIPGIIVDVNYTKMTCSVQPTIQQNFLNSDGTLTPVTLPLLINVPISWPGAKGFIITFPLPVNSEVLVVFSSRCIDAWWQQGGVQPAMEGRMHDLSDGFAIPGPRSLPNTTPGISETDLQIRNEAGTTYVSITADGKIKLVSPSEIDITAPTVSLTGSLVVTGEVTANGIPLSTHLHGGVTSGGADTGTPIP